MTTAARTAVDLLFFEDPATACEGVLTLLEGDLSFYELMKVMNAQKQRRGIEHVRQRLHDIDDYIADREARLARTNLLRTQPR